MRFDIAWVNVLINTVQLIIFLGALFYGIRSFRGMRNEILSTRAETRFIRSVYGEDQAIINERLSGIEAQLSRLAVWTRLEDADEDGWNGPHLKNSDTTDSFAENV